jgi:hypothetical protein
MQSLLILLPDGDPMPFDDNTHVLPGHLVPNDSMFVLPQYPEPSWNIDPNQLNGGQMEQPECYPVFGWSGPTV